MAQKSSEVFNDEFEFFYLETDFKQFKNVKVSSKILKHTCHMLNVAFPTDETKMEKLIATPAIIEKILSDKNFSMDDTEEIECVMTTFYCLKYLLDKKPMRVKLIE